MTFMSLILTVRAIAVLVAAQGHAWDNCNS